MGLQGSGTKTRASTPGHHLADRQLTTTHSNWTGQLCIDVLSKFSHCNFINGIHFFPSGVLWVPFPTLPVHCRPVWVTATLHYWHLAVEIRTRPRRGRARPLSCTEGLVQTRQVLIVRASGEFRKITCRELEGAPGSSSPYSSCFSQSY